MTTWKIGRTTIKLDAQAATPAASPAPSPARPAIFDEIKAAIEARDYAQAGVLAEQALAAGHEHPLVLNLAALRAEEDGRLEEALERLQRAVILAPKDHGARNALGLCLSRMERHAEALAAFDQALAIAPDFAGAHAARGGTFEALGRLPEADAAHRRALELQPGNHVALAGLANLASRRGAHAEAKALAEQVLAMDPAYPDAVRVAAAAELAAGDAPAAQRRLEALIADPRIHPQQLAQTQGALGDVLDAQDRPAEAFAAYAACNMGLWRVYAPAFGGHPSALEFARGMIERLDEIPASAWTATPRPLPQGVTGHVFLMGFPRSGTTLLEQVLASHPQVETLEERETLSAALRAFLATPQHLDRLAAASDSELGALREAYWARARDEGAELAGKVFVDKHPLNTFKLPLIARLFPQAKILFARRDPRDVVLSCYRRRFAMSGSAYQLLTVPGAAGYYDAAMQIADRMAPAMGAQTHVVRHEDLIADFDRVARAACDAVGIGWTEAMRDFAERVKDRGIATPSAAQLVGGLSAEGVGQWRRYRAQLAPALPRLAPWVERFGYAVE
ncbi:sulfotransferase [Phenylobacterium sp.]|uniref:tetratricopeptide repeat-containing sulfotransferase family protein n=1 Tax=Phenylobacterium sp. TaxID=1871053 RepID=UPI0025E5A201|nr:sulfotransferase [Phenylobacterium sp.]